MAGAASVQGLSYTTFSLDCAWQGAAGLPGSASCSVTNTGKLDGDEVVMVFHSVRCSTRNAFKRSLSCRSPLKTACARFSDHAQAGAVVRSAANHPVPIRSLIDFQRVAVPAGGKAVAAFSFTMHSIELVDENGLPKVYKGQHTFDFSRGHGYVASHNVTV